MDIMSDEEMKKLEESGEATDVISDEEMAALEQQNAPTEESSGEKFSTVESMARGAISGIPYATHAAAAINALADSKQDSFGERYNREKLRMDTLAQQSKDEDPWAFHGAEIATGIAGFAAAPGSMIIPKMFSWGMADQFSRHGDKPIMENIGWGVTNTALGIGAGKVVGKGIEAATPKIRSLANSTVGAWITDGMDRYAKMLNSHVSKWYGSAEKSVANQTDDFVKDLVKMRVDGQPLMREGVTKEVLRSDALKIKETAGKKIGEVLSKYDEKIAGEEVFSEMETALASKLQSDDMVTSDAARRFLDETKKSLFNRVEKTIMRVKDGKPEPETTVEWVSKDFSLDRLHGLKMDWAKRSRTIADKVRGKTASDVENIANEALEENIGILSKHIGERAEKVMVEEGSKSTWKALTKEYATGDVLEKISTEQLTAEGYNGVMQIVQRYMTGTTAAVVAKGMLGVSYPTAIAFGLGVKNILHNPELPPKLGGSLLKVANFLEKVPNHEIAMRIANASRLTTQKFHDEVMSASSKINLMEAPLPRDSMSVINNSDDILQIAEASDAKLAKELRRAIEDEDHEAVGATMDALSKNPNVRKYVQPGQGWNGRVYSPEDKAALIGTIQKTNMPFKQKMEQLKAVREQGTIPMEAPRQPEYFQYVERDKKNPEF